MIQKLVTPKSIFVLFLLLHIFLLNINAAEWGDSYRILRASEYIRAFSYPEDEKRQPLYSAALALYPNGADQVLSGRITMFLVSVVTFFVFYKLLLELRLSSRTTVVALLLFTVNPVFLYWSIRLMADVFFALIALIALYFYVRYKNTPKLVFLALCGVFCGLAVLTRFEGYILGFCIGIALLFEAFIKKDFRFFMQKLFAFGLPALLIMLPWLYFRNPLTSSYFEEPSSRTYDLTTFAIYLASVAYLFGFVFGLFFLLNAKSAIISFGKKYPAPALFIFFELLLALIWPAAIPRLFTPIIVFLCIFAAQGIDYYFSNSQKFSILNALFMLGLLILYPVVQLLFRLQFLVLIKPLLIVTFAIQLVIGFAIYRRRFSGFLFSLLISGLVWSIATIYLHKDIFRVIRDANIYIVQNLTGVVAYNDVSSVSDWYLNQRTKGDAVSGLYLNMDDKKGRSYDNLFKQGVNYVVITNEHNSNLEFNVSELSYLSPVREFSYTVAGTKFFTKVARFNP
ncbi:glycosyltransferase family 39 protein [Patescibacteria group bacterium]|nr:glycosyltransferase family 39 protein [Patescibacteria group bacterium]